MISDKELLERLKKETNICGGGTLISLVFCCGLEKPCPYRDEALKLLGISKETFRKVKEAHKLEHDTVCFKNLAYCCSLRKKCPIRDKALKDLGMSYDDYINYKLQILKDLIPPTKLNEALHIRIVRPLVMLIVDSQDKLMYKCLAIGNIKFGDIRLVRILDVKPLKEEE